MKRRLHLWLGICLVAFLILPTHPTGAGNLSLILPDGTGAGIADQPFDAFFLDSTGNLTVVLPNFVDITFAVRDPQITWTFSNPVGCTINPDGTSIKAETNKEFSFQVSAVSAAASLPVQLRYPLEANFTPGTTESPSTFRWTAQTGNFVAVFRAGESVMESQKVVDIHVAVPAPVDHVAEFVTTFYQMVGQQPDSNFDSWVTNLKNKSKYADDIAEQFFLNGGYNPTDQDFMANLYTVLLGRAPETGAIDFWLPYLASRGRSYMLDFFIHSSEFADRCTKLNILAYGTTTQYTVATNVSPANAGTVAGAGTYNSGATVTVTATPATGSNYTFSNWTEGVGATIVSTNNTYVFTAQSNRNLVANFTTSSTPPPAGSLTYTWGTIPYHYPVNSGEVITYLVNVPPPTANVREIRVSVYGGNGNTMGSISWQYPTGTLFPGQGRVLGNGSAAALRLLPEAGSQYLPSGQHVLRIYCEANGSYFRIQIDAY